MQNVKNCFDKIFFPILPSIFQIVSELFALLSNAIVIPLSVLSDKNVFCTPRNETFEIFFYAIFVSNCLKNQQ